MFTSSCSKCCRDIDIDPLDLFFPERMDARGREFIEATGLLSLSLDDIADISEVLPNGMLKVSHICDQLDTETNLCTIYETRPDICREYVCSTRTGEAACTQTIYPLKLVRKEQ